MEMSADEVQEIMKIVADCAENMFPDDIIRQAEHINKSYGSLLKLMETPWK